MTKIATVAIHHDELDAESWVPAETVHGYIAVGWVEGPLERLQAERDESEAKHLATARLNAAQAAHEQELREAQETGDTIRVAELQGQPIIADLDTIPPAPPKGGAGSGHDDWLEYATDLGLDLDPGLTRDEVIAAVDAAITRTAAIAAVDNTPSGDNPTTPEEG